MRGARLRALQSGRVGFACSFFWFASLREQSWAAQEKGGLARTDVTRAGGHSPAPPSPTWGCPSCPVAVHICSSSGTAGNQAAPTALRGCTELKPGQQLPAGRTNWETPGCSEHINVTLWRASGAVVVPPAWHGPGLQEPRGRQEQSAGQDAGCCADESTDSLCLFCLATALDFNV